MPPAPTITMNTTNETKLVADLNSDMNVRQEFFNDPSAILARYNIVRSATTIKQIEDTVMALKGDFKNYINLPLTQKNYLDQMNFSVTTDPATQQSKIAIQPQNNAIVTAS